MTALCGLTFQFFFTHECEALKMKEIMDRNGVPGNARLMSNSGWELGATDMDGIIWNPEENVIHFVQMAALEVDGVDGYDEKWIALK